MKKRRERERERACVRYTEREREREREGERAWVRCVSELVDQNDDETIVQAACHSSFLSSSTSSYLRGYEK
jgi:hypothetical protein